MNLSRRRFLEAGWKIGGGLLGVIAGWTSWELLRPLKTAGAAGKIVAGGTGNFQEGTATYVGQGRFYVVNAGGHLLALSQKCPHLGCRVPYCESSGEFECPCHGSVFDIGGEWLRGPAPRGMDQFEISLDGDNVVVDTRRRVDGPDHGARQFHREPKGPPCAAKG